MDKRGIEVINGLNLVLFSSVLSLAGGIIMGNAWSIEPFTLLALLMVVSGGGLVLAVIGFSLVTAFHWRATLKVVIAMVICAAVSMIVGLKVEIPEAVIGFLILGSWLLAIILLGAVRYIESLLKSVNRDIFR